MTQYIYPQNLKATANLWLWSLRDFVILAVAALLSVLALNFLARPDFVAYEVSCDHFAAPRVQRSLFHTPLAAWTVRDEKTCDSCLSRGEMPIFEGFVPEKQKSTEEKA